ncbi:hypothetical protein Hoch_0985 [Haliangium ochraceum DSM 14365]|uniref:Lipoprotein n=2 Tax=Haliangium ochraceum TaxID=80816 RepID=D0LQM6_HALO1|nr:hypothetical protein Hoch_0985 [Haliangium ochraceum DSM 14365]
MGLSRWLLIAALVATTASCFNPLVAEGVACSDEGECPSSQSCDPVDNRCYSELSARDPDAGPDSGQRDARIDPPPADAAPDASPDAGGCRGDIDCDDGFKCDLENGVCERPIASCQNQTLDGEETDTDCGGPDCPACAPGDSCLLARDCASGLCGGDQRCVAPQCGDGLVNQATEQCDEGTSNSDTAPDACRSDCQNPSCGDNVLDTGEEVDPPTSPSTVVPVDATTCRYDFSATLQLSCNNACGTPWNGFTGCQREDADALCKLLTGNPESTVIDEDSYTLEEVQATPGVCCPPPTTAPGTLGCVALANMSGRGVDVLVSIHETDMSETHGTGAVVSVESAAACTDP